MTASLDHTIVPVKDQDESVDFYTRVLDERGTAAAPRESRAVE